MSERIQVNYGIFHEAEGFWEGAEHSELRIQRCENCGKYVFYPREYCPHDMGKLTYEKVSGKGKVLTYSIVVRTGDPRFAEKTPFIAAVVQLDEGPTMYSRIVVDDPRNVVFNQEVEVLFEEQEGKKIPLFKPVENV